MVQSIEYAQAGVFRTYRLTQLIVCCLAVSALLFYLTRKSPDPLAHVVFLAPFIVGIPRILWVFLLGSEDDTHPAFALQWDETGLRLRQRKRALDLAWRQVIAIDLKVVPVGRAHQWCLCVRFWTNPDIEEWHFRPLFLDLNKEQLRAAIAAMEATRDRANMSPL